MSAVESRRNGKAASCEPCRKAKIRCDHKQPTCGRCERRGLTARCYYHPAPLTKPSRFSHGSAEPDIQPFSLHGNRAFRTAATTPTGRETTTAATPASYGQTPTAPWPLQSPDFHGHKPPVFLQTSSFEELYEKRFRVARDLVEQLRHLQLIERVIHQFATDAQAQLIPASVTMALVASVRAILTAYGLDETLSDEAAANKLAQDMLRNTEKPIVIHPDLDVDGFVALFAAQNIRLETMGLVFVMAARACLLGLARDDIKRTDFIQAMQGAGSSCLRLSRTLAVDNNDVMLWLAFDRVRLTTHIEGDTSPTCYRLTGDLATYLFEFNIHREAANANNTPFWLAECRRKLFAASYQIDKFIATLLDRPPRLLRRYGDCKMPLDLSDHEIVECMTEEQALLKVTSDGWNLKSQYSPSTWQRIRYMLGELREEVLEYNYMPPNPENDMRLRELSRRCHKSLESLPAHLRYDPACWDSGLPKTVCLMLLVMHVNYLQSDFQIHRLLEKFHPEAWETMLNVAFEIVEIILHLGTLLNRAIFLRHDFPYIVLGYALPCAAVLTATLQNTARSNGALKLPTSISKSTLIRNLSVFVSTLDSICTPGDANWNICAQASKAISRTLDEVLEGPTMPSNVPADAEPDTPMSGTNPEQPTQPFVMGPEAASTADLDFLNGDGFDGMDLTAWIKNIDWTVTGGEWSAF